MFICRIHSKHGLAIHVTLVVVDIRALRSKSGSFWNILLLFVLQRPSAAPVAPPAGGVPSDPADVRGHSPAQRPDHCQCSHRNPGNTSRLPHYTGSFADQVHRPLVPRGTIGVSLTLSSKTLPSKPPTFSQLALGLDTRKVKVRGKRTKLTIEEDCKTTGVFFVFCFFPFSNSCRHLPVS